MLDKDNNFYKFEIKGINFFWPCQFAFHELPSLYHETFSPTSANPHSYEFDDILILPNEWVVDAGACEGFFVHYALQRGANVLIIEPVPLLVKALSFTFRDQIEMGRVKILSGGLGFETSLLKLVTAEEHIYASAISNNGKEYVNIYTLDEILAQKIIPSINFIKMDIEGQEVNAIKGALGVIRNYKPKLSIAVYHCEENAKLIDEIVTKQVPSYKITYRGVWMRNRDIPRPYMLYGIPL